MKEEIVAVPDRHIHHSGETLALLFLRCTIPLMLMRWSAPRSARSDRRAARLPLYVGTITAEPRICSICFYLSMVRFSLWSFISCACWVLIKLCAFTCQSGQDFRQIRHLGATEPGSRQQWKPIVHIFGLAIKFPFSIYSAENDMKNLHTPICARNIYYSHISVQAFDHKPLKTI